MTTSTLMSHILGETLNEINTQYEEILTEIAAEYPHFSLDIRNEGKNRAAFFLPQSLLELGYQSLSGSPIDIGLRKRAMSFSLVCLSLAVGDDIIDTADSTFDRKMTLGCLSTFLMHRAYSQLIQDSSHQSRLILRHIGRLIASVSETALDEIQYRSAADFSVSRYLAITRKKTSCYTIESLLLAASLLECLSTQATLLTQLGDHFGTAIQLLDDLLDITEDGINRLPQLTYPAQLTSEGSSLTPIYSQIARELELAMLICQQLPYPSQLSNIFSSTQILMSKLHG